MRREQLPDIDWHYVEPRHEAIHAALQNWARWVRARPQRGKASPMWARCKPPQHWEAVEIGDQTDPIKAAKMEAAVTALPDKHRDAVRWCYVFRGNPSREARKLGVTLAGLQALVVEGRVMLVNRGA